MTPNDEGRYVIENNHFMVIATADDAGNPWVSPVGYAYDSDYNLYWVSSKEARHSQNIRANGKAAIVIYGQVPPNNQFGGVYLDATAAELEDDADIQEAITVYSQLKQPEKFRATSSHDVTGDAIWRIYKASSKNAFKRADSVDAASKQAITIRESIELQS